MAVVAEVATAAAADPKVAWDLLVEPETWTRWWPDCEAVVNVDRRALREGSRLELLVRPRHQKLTLHPEIDLMIPGRSLSMTHRGALLQGTIAWTLDPHPLGLRIAARGVFKGFLTLGNPWIHHDAAWKSTLSRAARGLKRAAELSS